MTILSRTGWYARRLSRMSPAEIAWRAREQALRRAWARRQVRPGAAPSGPVPGITAPRAFAPGLDGADVPLEARAGVVAAAGQILHGEWEMLGTVRTDLTGPDWFRDPVTGIRSDPGRFAFAINHRREEQAGNVKQVWEASRLQHLTLVAAAWYLTGRDSYASFVDDQLRSWCAENPFLSGINWTSGIELGIRLLNFAWMRRLLAGWPGAGELFEENDGFLRQLRWHQEYLAAFPSRGSSANNHLIAEAAGLLAASSAFPWFAESARWRASSAALLASSLRANTFPSGINRELATDYHGFVFELGAFAALEASAAGVGLEASVWPLLRDMADGMAALADASGRPPRQGDSDEGRAVLLDAPEPNRWPVLLSLGDALFGRLDWWPEVTPSAGGALAVALAASGGGGLPLAGRQGRPPARPSRFPDAGITILRTAGSPGSPEIWCRCDGGPHGFGSIAAHAHADALSVEVRHGGVDILADPGTYCYHGEPEWRTYFRSTIAHNTAEIGGVSQSRDGGPFLWLRQARTREIAVADPGHEWTAEHDGYARLRPGASHRRSVRLNALDRAVEITDVVGAAGHEIRLAFHLGPEVEADLPDPSGCEASLHWPDGKARLILPEDLRWSTHRGDESTRLGWYSPGLGRRIPSVSLVGRGSFGHEVRLRTRVIFSSGDSPGGPT